MRKRFWMSLFLFFFLGFASVGICAEQEAKKNYVEVKVALGKVSEVVFDEGIANVIKGGEKGSVLIEVKDESVYVLPKSENPCDVYIITKSGQRYYLDLVEGKGHDYSVFVNQQVRMKKKKRANSTIALLKALLAGNVPSGAMVIEKEEEIFNNGEVVLVRKVGYEYLDVTAYIVEALNIVNTEVLIPIQDINYPGLLAISSDKDILEPQKSTLIYMIIRN